MKSKFESFFLSLLYMLIGFAVQIVVAIIGGTIVSVMYFAKQDLSKADLGGAEQMTAITNEIMKSMNLILLVSSIVTVLTFILIYKIRKKKLWNEVKLNNTKVSNYGIALILGVSVWLFNMGFVSVLSMTGLFQSSFDAMEQSLSFVGSSNILVSILVVGIVAPFAEELMFRGVIYKTLSKSMSITSVIVLQGVLFGVYHMNLVQGLYATFLGILFGYVTYKTKSLWPAIIMHMVNNIVSTIAPSIVGENLDSTFAVIILLIIGFAITLVGTIIINKTNKNFIDDINDDIIIEK
ncbi:MAG: lysostaphin resistance A-like protein [Clostridium sp.]